MVRSAIALLVTVGLALGAGVALAADDTAAPPADAAAPAAPAAPKPEEKGPAKVGDMMPTFKVEDLSGASVTVDKSFLKGKTAFVLMNTACGSCRAELELASKLTEKMPTKVVAIAVDMRGAEMVKAYQEKYNFNVEYLLDTDFSVGPMFGLTSTPALFVVDGGGKVTYTKQGFRPNKDNDALIAAFK